MEQCRDYLITSVVHCFSTNILLKTFKRDNIEVWKFSWVVDTIHLPIYGVLLAWLARIQSIEMI